MLRVFRVLLGFAFACLVAGIATVLFVETPAEMFELAGIPMLEKATATVVLALRVATHSAIFAVPFAVVAFIIGEWNALRSWVYYASIGIIIAALGFLLQYSSEAAGQATIVNSYAMSAYFMSGLLGGLAYWLVSGRFAGGSQNNVASGQNHARPIVSDPEQLKPDPREARTEIRTKESKKALNDKASQDQKVPEKKNDDKKSTSVPVTENKGASTFTEAND